MIDQWITLQGAEAEAGNVYVLNVDWMFYEQEGWDRQYSMRELMALAWAVQLGPVL